MDKVSTYLWCDGNAMEAAEFYTGIFPESALDEIAHTPSNDPNGKKGDVITTALRACQEFPGYRPELEDFR